MLEFHFRADPKMGKSLKDANAPPRPLTAYFAWMKEHRAQVKEENPNVTNKELTKKLGEKWSSCTVDDKKPYMETAKTLMEEWKKKMEVYKKTDEYKEFMIKKRAFDQKKKAKGKGKKAKQPKDPNQPKRPSTGFFLFVQEKRPEVKASLPPEQQNKVTLVTKKCGAMWNDPANADMKAEYTARAQKLKEKWNEDMAAYKKTDKYREYQEQVAEWKEEQKNKNRKPARPPRRLSSDSDDSSTEGSS